MSGIGSVLLATQYCHVASAVYCWLLSAVMLHWQCTVGYSVLSCQALTVYCWLPSTVMSGIGSILLASSIDSVQLDSVLLAAVMTLSGIGSVLMAAVMTLSGIGGVLLAAVITLSGIGSVLLGAFMAVHCHCCQALAVYFWDSVLTVGCCQALAVYCWDSVLTVGCCQALAVYCRLLLWQTMCSCCYGKQCTVAVARQSRHDTNGLWCAATRNVLFLTQTMFVHR